MVRLHRDTFALTHLCPFLTLKYSFIDLSSFKPYTILPNTIPSQLEPTSRLGIIWLIAILTQSTWFNTFTQMTFTQLAFILSTLTVFVVYWMNGERRGRNFPPGPKKYPLIGSLLSMPSTLEWETFAKWGQEYSPWWIETVFLRLVFIECFVQIRILFMSTL
jgi:hypothetical protein